MKPSFYFDLDETLISSRSINKNIVAKSYTKEGKGLRKNGKILNFNNKDFYETVLLPSAKLILYEARKIANRVCILTSANQEYAEEINKTFELGFNNNDIYGNEKYIVYEDIPNSFSLMPRLKAVISKPENNAILIDNAPKDFTYTKIKMSFLGEKTKYFLWPNFNGQRNEGKKQFEKWCEILAYFK